MMSGTSIANLSAGLSLNTGGFSAGIQNALAEARTFQTGYGETLSRAAEQTDAFFEHIKKSNASLMLPTPESLPSEAYGPPPPPPKSPLRERGEIDERLQFARLRRHEAQAAAVNALANQEVEAAERVAAQELAAHQRVVSGLRARAEVEERLHFARIRRGNVQMAQANALANSEMELSRRRAVLAENEKHNAALIKLESDAKRVLIERNRQLGISETGLGNSQQRTLHAMRAGEKAATRHGMALQQLAFMVEDAGSVYGTAGLAGAIRAGSNNLSQFAMLMGASSGIWVSAALGVGMLAAAFIKVGDSEEEAAQKLRNYIKDLDKFSERAQRLERGLNFQADFDKAGENAPADAAKAFEALNKGGRDSIQKNEARLAGLKREISDLSQESLKQGDILEKAQLRQARLRQLVVPNPRGPDEPNMVRAGIDLYKSTKEIALIEKKRAEIHDRLLKLESEGNALLNQNAQTERQIADAAEAALAAKERANEIEAAREQFLSAQEATEKRIADIKESRRIADQHEADLNRLQNAAPDVLGDSSSERLLGEQRAAEQLMVIEEQRYKVAKEQADEIDKRLAKAREEKESALTIKSLEEARTRALQEQQIAADGLAGAEARRAQAAADFNKQQAANKSVQDILKDLDPIGQKVRDIFDEANRRIDALANSNLTPEQLDPLFDATWETKARQLDKLQQDEEDRIKQLTSRQAGPLSTALKGSAEEFKIIQSQGSPQKVDEKQLKELQEARKHLQQIRDAIRKGAQNPIQVIQQEIPG